MWPILLSSIYIENKHLLEIFKIADKNFAVSIMYYSVIHISMNYALFVHFLVLIEHVLSYSKHQVVISC